MRLNGLPLPRSPARGAAELWISMAMGEINPVTPGKASAPQ